VRDGYDETCALGSKDRTSGKIRHDGSGAFVRSQMYREFVLIANPTQARMSREGYIQTQPLMLLSGYTTQTSPMLGRPPLVATLFLFAALLPQRGDFTL
jgi:hypothetical protein